MTSRGPWLGSALGKHARWGLVDSAWQRSTTTIFALVALGVLLFTRTNSAQPGAAVSESITGKVVDAAGKAVPGAEVWLVAHSLADNRAVTLSKARSSGDGRFRLEFIEHVLQWQQLNHWAIWAYKPGMQLATIATAYNRTRLGFDTNRVVQLTLGPPAAATFRVIDPSGKFAAGTALELIAYDEGKTAPPAELAAKLSARTGPDGRATLTGVARDQVRGLRVTTDAAGTQTFYFGRGSTDKDELVLNETLPLDGQITADDPAAVRGVMVHLLTDQVDPRPFIGGGEALVVTDNQGRFHVPALARGRLYVSTLVPEGSLFQPLRIPVCELAPDRIKVPMPGVPGLVRVGVRVPHSSPQSFHIDIPLKRMVRVSGVIREKGSGKPIPNVGIIFGAPDLTYLLPMAVTDAQGKYEALAPPGERSYYRLSDPKAYNSPLLQGYFGGLADHARPVGSNDHQLLPPIELEGAASIKGVVVDELGAAVAHAVVVGKWESGAPADAPEAGPRGAYPPRAEYSVTATTGPRGEFALEGIKPRVKVQLEASAAGRVTEEATSAAAGTKRVIRLVVQPTPKN